MFNFPEAKEMIFFESVDLQGPSTNDYQLLSLNFELIKMDTDLLCFVTKEIEAT